MCTQIFFQDHTATACWSCVVSIYQLQAETQANSHSTLTLPSLPARSTCWLALSYLPQEVLSEFQVLQPLFIHSIYFGELGCQNCFL